MSKIYEENLHYIEFGDSIVKYVSQFVDDKKAIEFVKQIKENGNRIELPPFIFSFRNLKRADKQVKEKLTEVMGPLFNYLFSITRLWIGSVMTVDGYCHYVDYYNFEDKPAKRRCRKTKIV